MRFPKLASWIALASVALAYAATAPSSGEEPNGFHGVAWGSSSNDVRTIAKPSSWSRLPDDNSFPREMNVSRYAGRETIAGYPATVTYYFMDDKLVQATIAFDFSSLVNFDFNYNVFISVDRYYTAIHDQTMTFVADIYDLLRKKYGKKEPWFKDLDPRTMFVKLDKYLNQERWNLRYNPSEYCKRIVAAAYARWDFPKTTAIFSVNISAADKRFDYQLSLSSVELSPKVLQMKDSLRMRGL